MDEPKLTNADWAPGSERLYFDAVAREMREGLCVVRAETGTLVYANARLAEILRERGSDFLLGRSFLGLFPADQHGVVQDALERLDAELVVSFEAFAVAARVAAHSEAVPVRTRLSSVTDPERGSMWVSLIEDITEERGRNEAWLQSETRYRALVSNAPVAIVETSVDGECRFVNDTWCEMTGLSREASLGIDWRAALHPDNASRISDEWAQHLESEHIYRGEIQLAHAEGGARWALASAVTLQDSAGSVTGYLGTFVDISDRVAAEEQVKRSLREKHILLQEIHHRVKNNLQIVSSLVAMQAAQVSDAEARRAFSETQSRIRSIAMLHQKLYGTKDVSEIDMSEYIRDLVQSIRGTQSHQNMTIECNCDRVFMSLDRAVPCGLILNELVTNSLKHAFLIHRRTNRIEVRLVRDDASFVLEVIDNGVGLPEDFDLNASTSLGMGLVRILTEQLGGSIEAKSEHGSHWTIRFPAQAAD